MSKTGSSPRENNQRPNKTVLTPPGGHDIPAAINSPGCRQGHGLSAGLEALGAKVLTCRRPPGTESAVWRTRQLLLGAMGLGRGPGRFLRDEVEADGSLTRRRLLASAVRYGAWVLDMMDVVRGPVAEGWTITADQLGALSPYLRAHINRFGAYATDELTHQPGAFNLVLKEADFTALSLAAWTAPRRCCRTPQSQPVITDYPLTSRCP